MEKELTVGQVMAPIEEYNTVAAEAPLCDALFILKANLKKIESGEKGPLHKTLLAVDPAGQIIGKLSIFDLIRGSGPGKGQRAGGFPDLLSVSFRSAVECGRRDW